MTNRRATPTTSITTATTTTTITPIISLHQRILYPPSNKYSPPRILQSKHFNELDPLLLDLISLICRENVLIWYNKISKDTEKNFIREISNIFIQVVKELDIRILKLNLVELILINFINILINHLKDFNKSLNSNKYHNLNSDEIFNLIQQHISISLIPSTISTTSNNNENSIPVVDKIYLRALVDNLLSHLLPIEDYKAETERTIIIEIIVNIILGSLFDKVAQPWFLYQVIVKILEGREQDLLEQEKTKEKLDSGSKDQTLLNSTLSTLASIPSFLKAISITLSTIYNTIISSPVPSHYAQEPPLTTPLLEFLLLLFPPSTSVKQLIHYLQFILTIFSTFFTSLIFYLFNFKLFNVKFVKNCLELTTRSLFPNGHPPPKEDEPDEEGKDALRIRCEKAVARALPGK